MRTVSADVKNKDFAPVYLIYGEEAYLRENYRNSLLKALVTPGDSLNFASFSGDGADAGEIVSLAMTLPFMAERRVIYVKDSGFFKKGADEIADYIEEPSQETVLIFNESEINKNTRTYKIAKKCGYIAEAVRYDRKKLPQWVAANFKRYDKKVSADTVNLLIERAGSDMSALDMEIKKLSSYAEGRESVEAEDVMKLVTRSPSYSVFQMINAIGDRKLNEAVGIYYDMMQEEQNVYGIFTLLSKQFRLMLEVSDLKEKRISDNDIAEMTGLSYGLVKKYSIQAGKFTRPRMIKALEECVRAPREIAQGKISKEAAVELLVVGVAST